MPVSPFIVYYRVDDKRGAVRILTVRHGARRQPQRWKD
jgi:plasmid stabilization system protein ParE